MTKTIKVKNEVTKDIQEKDIARQTAMDILMEITNAHANDTNADFLQSPVYKELQRDAEEKRVLWDRAKDEMVKNYIPEETQKEVKSWTLDYLTSELLLEV